MVLPFWYRLTRVVPEKRAVKRVYVVVVVSQLNITLLLVETFRVTYLFAYWSA